MLGFAYNKIDGILEKVGSIVALDKSITLVCFPLEMGQFRSTTLLYVPTDAHQ